MARCHANYVSAIVSQIELRRGKKSPGRPGTLGILNGEGKWPCGHENEEKETRFLRSGIKRALVLPHTLPSPLSQMKTHHLKRIIISISIIEIMSIKKYQYNYEN